MTLTNRNAAAMRHGQARWETEPDGEPDEDEREDCEPDGEPAWWNDEPVAETGWRGEP